MILKFLLKIPMIWMIFFKNIEEYNPNKKRKMLIVFYDIFADIFSNKKAQPISNWIIH